MKKIGFIDYYLDEWHANNYPRMLRQWTPDFEVAYAWAKIDSPLPGGLTTKEWEAKYGVKVLDTMEEVIEKSDCLVVLAPDNPEVHEELCKLPLQSGKPTFIDKTFTETLESAKRIFAVAEEANTACYSASALYYTEEYKQFYEKEVAFVDSCGPKKEYIVHQLEPIVAMLKEKPVRAMSVGTEEIPVPHENTLSVIAAREIAYQAMEKPYEWVYL